MAGGQVVNVSAGTVTSSVTVALVGIAIAVSSGVLTPNNVGTVPLVGQSITVQQGAVAPAYSRALAGSAITLAAGNLGIALRPTDIVGQAINVSPGTLVAQGSGVTVNLSGIEAVFGQGVVGSGSTLLSSLVASSGMGTVKPGLSIPLVGQAVAVQQGLVSPAQDADDTLITSFAGTMAPSLSIPLVGQAVAVQQGIIGITGDVTLPLTGQSVSVLAGIIISGKAFPLTGQQIVISQYPMGAPGGAALTGQQVSVQQGTLFTDGNRTTALTGQAVTVQQGITFASSLAFPLGQEIVVQQQSIGPRSVTLTGLLIAVQQGVVVVPSELPPGGSHGHHHHKHKHPPHPPAPHPEPHPRSIDPYNVSVPPDWHADDEKVYEALAQLVIQGHFDGNG